MNLPCPASIDIPTLNLLARLTIHLQPIVQNLTLSQYPLIYFYST